MAVAAFQIIRASTINRIQPIVYSAVQSGPGIFTTTTTEQDAPGCSVTFTTATAAICTATIFCDTEVTATGASVVFQGRLNVDGSTITSKEAHTSGASLGRPTIGQVIDFTLSGAGSHTVKLRVVKSAAAGTFITYDNHTGFSLQVREVV